MKAKFLKLSREFLVKEYIKQRKSVPNIASETGVNIHVIYRLLKKFNITTRIGNQSEDYTDQSFGEWIVIKKHPTRRATWICRCSCGVDKPVRSSNFLSGGSTKCTNCLKKGCGEISGTKWSNIRNGANQRKIKFDITVEYAWSLFLEQERKCALTGLPVKFGIRNQKKEIGRGNTTASLDRIDSKKGYVDGNVHWVLKKINMMKQGYSIKEFIETCEIVAKHASTF